MRSNLRAHAAFIAILLLFCYFAGQSATANTNNLPESVIELLSGKTTDFNSVATQIPEHQLPSTLAAAKLLKFRALHGETSISSNEADSFETILLNRIDAARQVAFSQNETCSKKVEQHEIMFDGQKLLVPTHFVADTNLAIISCQPKGEAGSLFPDFNIEGFSQSPLAEITLAIDGQTIDARNILVKQGENAFKLSYQTPATPDSLLSIGTHTAEITINNQSGETVKQEWLFTVGVHDTSTMPLPAEAVIISEINLSLEKILPGVKAFGLLTLIVYQNAAGTRFTEYRFTTATGQTITSQNLAFIARRITAGRDSADELTISPQTRYAFAGNLLNFSYTYAGSGNIISEKWLISSGGHSTTEPVITMNGSIVAECTITVEKKQTNSAGEEVVYQHRVTANRYISQATIKITELYTSDPNLQYAASCSFAIKNNVVSNISNIALVEGKKYTVEGSNKAGILTVDKLSWHIHASEGSFKIENPSATSTRLISNTPGYAELVLNIKLTWQEAGETYSSTFKPSVSALFANYPITAKAEFSKYPPGIIYLTSRHIELKSFEFSIKNQKRLIADPGACELANPILICKSSIWPASAPIVINQVAPMLSHGNKKKWLDEVSPFIFQTPVELDENVHELPLCLGGNFYAPGYFTKELIISDLPSVKIFSWEDDLLSLNLEPAGPVTVYEGAETKFSAEVQPSPGMGGGILSATDKTLDLLDGYKVASVEGIVWFETPLDFDDDWNNIAAAGQDYSHIFDPGYGPGSYTMNCTAVMKIKESDTGDSFIISAQNKAPVDFLPGLRIFSPINELAYPLHASLKVKTSFDKDNDAWKKIKWHLNGKEFKPGVGEAPFFMDLNRTGKWSLQAELTVKDPETDEDMLLKDRVDFIVNPVEISLTPTRKVLDFSLQQSQELSLNITLNGKKIEKPGQTVVWQDDGFEAVVDPIEWFSATAPNGCASVNHDENSLTANVIFANAGAATALATVTVRLIGAEEVFKRKHKNFEDEFEEPIFAFPAVRADAWTVPKPTELTFQEEDFPKKGIAAARRTFAPKLITFHLGEQQQTWLPDPGLKPGLTLKPAIPFQDWGSGPSASLGFSWKGPEEQNGNDSSFQPLLPTLGQHFIALETFLAFGQDEHVSLGVYQAECLAEDFYSLVKASVDPASFPIWVGQNQRLTFVIEATDQPPRDNPLSELPPSIPTKTPIQIQGGNFQAEIESVSWVKNGSVLGTGNPYDYSAKAKVVEMITGKAKVEVTEAKISLTAKPTLFDHTADTKTVIGRLIAYPGEGYVFPASYPITFRARDNAPQAETIQWFVGTTLVGVGKEIRVPGLETGPHTVKAILPFVSVEETRAITAFPWSFAFAPERKVVLGPKKDEKITIDFELDGKFDGKPIASGTELIINDAKVLISSFGLDSTTVQNGCAEAGFVIKTNGIATFTEPGALTIQTKGFFRVLQPDKQEELYDLPKARCDLWALGEPKDIKIDGSFPEKAIAKTRRTFEVKKFAFTLESEIYSCLPNDLDKSITLSPALTPGPTLTCSSLDYSWKHVLSTKSREPVFIPEFPEKGISSVTVDVSLIFESPIKVPIYSKETTVTTKRLEDVVDIFVDPSSFTLILGENQELKINILEKDSSQKEVSNTTRITGDSIEILQGSYLLTLTKVDWSDNGSDVPAKRTIESDPYVFYARQIGPVTGKALISLSIVEAYPKSLKLKEYDFSLQKTWRGSVSSPLIKMFLNGNPLGSENYHIGQEIELSYSISPSLPQGMEVKSTFWSVSKPLPIEHKTESPNKAETISLSSEDLKNPTIKFFLLSFDPERPYKVGSLTLFIGSGQSETFPISSNFHIDYEQPFVASINIEKNQPIMALPISNVWKFGFPIEDQAGAQAKGNVHNPTAVPYKIAWAQMAVRDNFRSFWLENDKTKEQKLKTIPASAPLTTKPEYWLDTYPLGVGPGNPEHLVLPGLSLSQMVLVDDIPLFELKDDLGTPKNYDSNTYFKVFICVKPAYYEDYLAGFWCPIKILTWSWGGEVLYNREKLTWIDDPANYYFNKLTEKKLLEFYEWPDRAVSGYDHPEWRDIK